jgi:hypothetical protein
MVYPTGGYTKYDYEPHKAFFSDPICEPLGPCTDGPSKSVSVGGLRIKTISTFDGINTAPSFRQQFKYGENETGTGEMKVRMYSIFYNYTQQLVYLGTTNNNNDQLSVIGTERLRTYLGTPLIAGALADMGCHVFYPEVTVHESGSSVPNGKTLYTYNKDAHQGHYFQHEANTSMAFSTNQQWAAGKLKDVTKFKYDSSSDGGINNRDLKRPFF